MTGHPFDPAADGTDRTAGSDGPHAADGAAGGPLGAEALRLVSAMQAWAQGWAERTAGAPADGHTGSDCQWCPLCQFLAVLRGERPELTERVAEAGTAMVGVLRALLQGATSGAGEDAPHDSPGASPRVQKINLADEL